MKSTKYKFITEVTIPNEDKYNLEKIVRYITDICYKINNPSDLEIPRVSCHNIGIVLINNTYFHYNHTFNHVELQVPVEHKIENNRIIYNFDLKFSIHVDNEKELDNVKKEYEQRILKFMYERSRNKFDKIETEEIEE